MKTFRKSSLISSVALLLVAIVALSGATFAWFSTNNEASTTAVQMKATSANGIWIADGDIALAELDDSDWTNELPWGDVKENMPAVSGTLDGTTSFFKTSSDNSEGTWTDAEISTTTAGSDYIVKKVWVKAGTTEEVTLTVSPTVTGGKGYERVAVVDPDGTVTIMDNAGDTYEAFTDQEGNTDEVTATVYGDVTTTGKFDEAKLYTFYIWFEGQDAQCKNINSGSTFSVSIDFGI